MSAKESQIRPPTGNEIKKVGYSIYLRIPEGRFECYCSYVPTENGTMITKDELCVLLDQYNVKFDIDYDALDDFAVKAAAGIKLVDMLLASGLRPVNGTDEYLDIIVKPSTPIPTAENHTSIVDMYLVQTFLNISADEEIGRIVPAGEGVPGRNITGELVPALHGKPMKTKIGRNIRVERDTNVLFAASTGRLCQSAVEISVEEEFVVKRNVDFRVGTIDFRGVVNVKGDVQDNFNITAKKGLKVAGNIGACSINSDGDITFCGMDGAGKGSIYCGGTLRANFIHDTDIECKGDMIVGVELHNCNIRALGKIIVEKGAIIGGTCIAMGGIEARKLGSVNLVKTVLHAGDDYNDLSELDSLQARLTELEFEAKFVLPLLIAMEMRKEIAGIKGKIIALKKKDKPTANPKINVKGALYGNVHMTLGKVTEEIKETREMAKSIIENTVEGGFRYLTLNSLFAKAWDMETAIIRDLDRDASST